MSDAAGTGSGRDPRRGGARRARARLGRGAPRRERRRPARPDAPLGRPRHGRGGHGPLPGHAAGHRPGHRGRLLLRLRAAASADAGRPGGHRGAHGARRSPPTMPSCATSWDPRGGPGLVRRAAGSPTRSRSSTTCAAAATAAGQPMPPVSTYQHGPFIDLCRGPHVASTGAIGPFKLLSVAGAYWRGDEDAADAPAHLRHGLGHPGGARPLPVAAGGGQQARPPPPRRRARPVQLPRRQPRARPSGIPRAGRSGGRCAAPCASCRRGAATRRSTRHRSSTRSSGSGRATGSTTATTCSWSSPRGRPSASSP